MGLSLKSLGKKIYEFATPQNENAMRAAQSSIQGAQQRIQQTNGGYGVLANPQARQRFIQRNQVVKPSFTAQVADIGDSADEAIRKTILQPFITRRGAEVVSSIRDLKGNANSSYTPGSSWEKELFGDTPIDSIQKKVADQYQRQSTSSNQALRVASRPLAVAEGLLSVADDTPVVGGATRVVGKVLKESAPAAKIAFKAAEKVDQRLFDNPSNAALRQQYQKAYDVETNPTRKKQISQGIAELDSQSGSVAVPSKSKVAFKVNSDEAYRLSQSSRESQYTQPGTAKALNALKRELVDPRQTQQRLDNQEFKRLKAAGQIKPGQKELLPEQSLAVIRGKIENPQRAAEVRNNQKYTTETGNQWSVNDIIKHYGKENGQKARDFENYRIYKDELDRINHGSSNSIGVNPDEMANYIRSYEVSNPLALEHNASLRQASLEALSARREAGIDAPDLFDTLSQYTHYNPRKALDPEELIRAKMTGGVRSGAKGTQARSETAGGPVRSPLSLFRDTNQQLERSLAEQLYGRELRRRTQAGTIPGAREVVNADTVIKHKKALNRLRELGDAIKESRKVRDTIKGDKARTEASLGRSTSATKQAEDKVVAKMQALLASAKGDRNNVYNDLVERDPRFASEAAGIKAQKFPNLTKQEARDQIRHDLQQLGKKYPKPAGYSRKELLELAHSISRNNEPLGELTGKATVSKKLSANLQGVADDVNSMLAQARQNVDELGAESKATFGDFSQTTQHLDRGTQTYSYKVNGEVGKIEIPNDLATELSKANELQNLSMLEKGLKPVSGAQKLTWTGVLQPAFKVWNVLVKNPLLAYRNADGLSGVRPEAVGSIVRQVLNTKKIQAFKNEMKSRGIAYENALQSKNVYSSTADDIAARTGVISFFKRNPVSTLQDVWKGINSAVAYPDNVQRTAVAYGAYKKARGLGFSEKEALDIASQAPAKVFGDFDRVSRLAQNAEIIIPYTGAIQAGARSLGRASKTKPFQTGLKDASLLSAMAGITAYSMGNNSEYYKDMKAQGKEYYLDNNWTFVLPGASKDADGNWSGVLHVPLTPDFRPLNRATWRSVDKIAGGNSPDAKLWAEELFNTFTGDTANSLYDSKKGKNNPANGVLPMSPVVNTGKILSGINTYDGKPLADEYTASRPRTEQTSTNTSEGAVSASKAVGGLLTPQQFDQVFNQIGGTGDIIQGKEKPGIAPILKPLKPGISQTEDKKQGTQFYKDLDQVASGIQDRKIFNEFKALHTKDEGEKTLDKQAEKYKQYLAQPALFEAERKLDSLNRQRGSAGNPLFDLTPDQQQKVMRYRGAKDLNSAKQAYDKNGNPLFTALGLDEKWYDDFRTKEDSFYSSIKGTSDETSPLSYSGAAKPKASPEIESKLNYYYTLPSGTGQRSAFLKANPDVLDYWAQGNQFTNAERLALGLKISEDDKFKSKSSGYASGQKDDPTANAYKYAVSLSAGGKVAKAKISANKTTAKSKVSSKPVGRAKLSIKKSLV